MWDILYSFYWTSCASVSLVGLGARGVGGAFVPRRFRFQNPALGPFITNANVQRERPRRVSGRWIAAVSKEDSDRININLDEESCNELQTFLSKMTRTFQPNVHSPVHSSAIRPVSKL